MPRKKNNKTAKSPARDRPRVELSSEDMSAILKKIRIPDKSGERKKSELDDIFKNWVPNSKIKRPPHGGLN